MYLLETQGEHIDLSPTRVIDPQRFAYLGWQRPNSTFGISEVLSHKGNSLEAAARFFAVLRRLGRDGREGIIAELPPEHGLGKAIRDRLQRGASGYAQTKSHLWEITTTS